MTPRDYAPGSPNQSQTNSCQFSCRTPSKSSKARVTNLITFTCSFTNSLFLPCPIVSTTCRLIQRKIHPHHKFISSHHYPIRLWSRLHFTHNVSLMAETFLCCMIMAMAPLPYIRKFTLNDVGEKLAINMKARSQHKTPHLHKRESSVVKTFMNERDPRFRYWFDWMCLPNALTPNRKSTKAR